MPVFKYSVRDHAGKIITGKITADNEAVVIAQLRKSDVFITSIEEEKIVVSSNEIQQPVRLKRKEKSPRKKKITSKDIVIFSRQFATMVDANIPISQAMDALVEQTINPSLKKI